jgi:hypothetical protein
MKTKSAQTGHQRKNKTESVERAYLGRVVSDWDGRSCSGDDYVNLGIPLMTVIPELRESYSAPQIVEIAKKLEACGCDFTKLAAHQREVN